MKTLTDFLSERSSLREALLLKRRELEALEASLEQNHTSIATLVEEQRHSLSFAALDLGKLPTLSYDYTQWEPETTYALPYFIQQKLRARDQEKLVFVSVTEEGFALTFGELSTRAPRALGELGKEEVLRSFTFTELDTLLREAKEWEAKLSSAKPERSAGGTSRSSIKNTLSSTQLAALAALDL